MTADITIKQGDLEPSVRLTLAFSDGQPVDLTSAVTVKFRMADVLTHVEVFSRDMTVDGDPTLGNVLYIWQAGDTDAVGVYYAEVSVEWPGNRHQTYPPEGYITISIEPVV